MRYFSMNRPLDWIRKGGADFLNLLRELKSEGKAIFMSTHDIFRAKEIADRIGILVGGNLVRELTRQEIETEGPRTVIPPLCGGI